MGDKSLDAEGTARIGRIEEKRADQAELKSPQRVFSRNTGITLAMRGTLLTFMCEQGTSAQLSGDRVAFCTGTLDLRSASAHK
ncbi:hypothetical protein Q7C36_008086 [Tachysurus vachellii]|uniref:Uncharacterized protein n=1 Tax=Tachysurus vachellii TaxID=175792 RepID=A0AA88SXY4_TACVA|nr:hypothetical protein Q7C36_008086 [Tachysurus vachellii]